MREVFVIDGIKVEVSTAVGTLHSKYSEQPQAWQDLINSLRQATINSSLEKLEHSRHPETSGR